MAVTKSIAERFWNKVEKLPDGPGCWVWSAACHPDGYGIFGISPGRTIRAHRYAWILTRGEIPHGLHVLHRCDVPPCVNPSHLWLGTTQDNMADKFQKGRNVYGDKHWSRRMPQAVRRGTAVRTSKLDEAAVRAIRMSTGHADLIAAEHGITARHVRKIKARQQWRHIQ